MDVGEEANWNFYIENTGGETLSWSISESIPWASASHTEGDTTTETDTITVHVDTSGLEAGQHYDGHIYIISNGGNEDVYIELETTKYFVISIIGGNNQSIQRNGTLFANFIVKDNSGSPINGVKVSFQSNIGLTFANTSYNYKGKIDGMLTISIDTSSIFTDTLKLFPQSTAEYNGKNYLLFADENYYSWHLIERIANANSYQAEKGGLSFYIGGRRGAREWTKNGC
ncbi:hypothetical protein B6U81_00995 [Thermoplasmatales archaeon ex4484_30]|nr:MAG: hypothetical protein B6U81_00995 [Thermoplasmatales archaeon ex4484_30]